MQGPDDLSVESNPESPVKEGQLLMARAVLDMPSIPFLGGDGGLFGIEWAACWVKLSTHHVTYVDENTGSGETLQLTQIVAIQPEETDGESCLLLKVRVASDEEEDETNYRLRATEGSPEDDLQQWKMAILMNVEAARDEERTRNGQFVRSPSFRGSVDRKSPNTHPNGRSPRADLTEMPGPPIVETISAKGRPFTETPREEDTTKDAMLWALQKEKDVEVEVWRAKWEANEDRVAALEQERDLEKMHRVTQSKEHNELVAKLEAMHENEAEMWRGRCDEATRLQEEAERKGIAVGTMRLEAEWRDRVAASEERMAAQKADSEAEISALRTQLAAGSTDANTAMGEELKEAQQAKATLEAQVASLQESLEALKSTANTEANTANEAAELRERLVANDKRLVQLEEEHRVQKEEWEETQSMQEALVTKLEAMREDDRKALEAEIDTLRAQADHKPTESVSQEEWEARTAALLEEQKVALANSLTQKLAEAEASAQAQARDASEVARSTQEALEQQLGIAREETLSLQNEVDTMEASLEAEKAQSLSFQEKIAQVEADNASLRAQVEELEGLLLDQDDDNSDSAE